MHLDRTSRTAMSVEGLAHPIARTRGPGLITQCVDHPAAGYSPSPDLFLLGRYR